MIGSVGRAWRVALDIDPAVVAREVGCTPMALARWEDTTTALTDPGVGPDRVAVVLRLAIEAAVRTAAAQGVRWQDIRARYPAIPAAELRSAAETVRRERELEAESQDNQNHQRESA